MKTDTTPKTVEEHSLESPSTPCSGFFICPSGDLHRLRPDVDAIWIQEARNWWQRIYQVRIQYEGDNDYAWEWDEKTKDAAIKVRDRLIEIHSQNRKGFAERASSISAPSVVWSEKYRT
jgi:hypothetical protein